MPLEKNEGIYIQDTENGEVSNFWFNIIDMINVAFHDRPFVFYPGYFSGEARLPLWGSESLNSFLSN